MNKNEILSISEEYGLAPNKRLGQNFLINDEIIGRIILTCSPENKRIMEIGPGLGSLSLPLEEKSLSYTAVEIDSGFVKYLSDVFKNSGKARIIHGDFLKSEIDDRFDLIVSNLPYYCASEILFRIAEHFTAQKVFVMVQKEMAERIVARPGTVNYGALTVTLSYYFEPRILFHIPGESFYPKPDVKSSFLKLERKPLYFKLPEQEKLFHLIVKSAFWGRRKTLLKTLAESPHLELGKDTALKILTSSGISPGIRGETLSLDEFIKLTEGVIASDG
jgi:16S rRNA (adenine1518-N6/adenine1519-N6)-dimethyltransferase